MRRILSLLLVVLILSATILSVSADAFLPPEYISYNIMTAHQENDSCYALNVFLSNFVEIGLKKYDSNTSPSEMMAAVLKHLEINASFFADDVKKVDGENGKTYMRVTEEIFNTRMKKLFGRTVPASGCPGYEDGSILVSADHFGGPIQVFASVYSCAYESAGVYRVEFDAYFVNKDFSGWHGTANRNLPAENLTLLGKGSALIQYTGNDTLASISSSSFSLVEFSMDAQGIPCAGENLPYGVEETEPPTEAPTEAPTETTTEATTEATDETAKEKPKKDSTQDDEEPDLEIPDKDISEEYSDGADTVVLVLIITAVLVVAILVLIIVLVIFKKK